MIGKIRTTITFSHMRREDKAMTFDDEEILEIEDTETGDTYYYDVVVDLDAIPTLIDLREMIDEME